MHDEQHTTRWEAAVDQLRDRYGCSRVTALVMLADRARFERCTVDELAVALVQSAADD